MSYDIRGDFIFLIFVPLSMFILKNYIRISCGNSLRRILAFLSNLFDSQQFANTMFAKGVTEPWMATLRRLRQIAINYIQIT